MSQQKRKALILLCGVFVVILIVIALVLSRANTESSENKVATKENEYVFHFNETIDLNEVDPSNRYEDFYGTDYPNMGQVDASIRDQVEYRNGKLYVPSEDGYSIVTYTWQSDGFGAYINEPTFGTLEKVISGYYSFSAKYSQVKMKDTISYINELSGIGFNDVIKDEKNTRNDYYIYSAKKGDLTVTLNYEKGILEIYVFGS